MARHYRSSRLRRALITACHFIHDHGPCLIAATIGGGIALFVIAALVMPKMR